MPDELTRQKQAPMPTAVDLFEVALAGANNAMPVLMTMLRKVGLKEGLMVADEIAGNIACALKVLRERQAEAGPAVPTDHAELIARLKAAFDEASMHGQFNECISIKAQPVRDALAALTAVPRDPEVCICSAIRFKDGTIIRGHRHDDAKRVAWGKGMRPSTHGEHEQGFLTTRNRFVDREEGQRLQLAAGIESVARGDEHTKDGYRGNELYSEDLY